VTRAFVLDVSVAIARKDDGDQTVAMPPVVSLEQVFAADISRSQCRDRIGLVICTGALLSLISSATHEDMTVDDVLYRICCSLLQFHVEVRAKEVDALRCESLP